MSVCVSFPFRAKKQRLLQSSMFISTITSWDYGYQFFLLYWHVVVSKLKLSIFCERTTHRIREIVSFEFGEEIEKDLRLDALTLSLTDYGERGIRRSEVRFLMGTQKCFFFPTLVTRRKTSFSVSLPSSKLIISLIPITNMTPSTLLILAVCRTRVIWTLW